MLEELLLVVLVGGPLLLLGATFVFLARRGSRGLDQRVDRAFGGRMVAVTAFVAGIIQLVVVAIWFAEDGVTWQVAVATIAGIGWLALAVHLLSPPKTAP